MFFPSSIFFFLFSSNFFHTSILFCCFDFIFFLFNTSISFSVSNYPYLTHYFNIFLIVIIFHLIFFSHFNIITFSLLSEYLTSYHMLLPIPPPHFSQFLLLSSPNSSSSVLPIPPPHFSQFLLLISPNSSSSVLPIPPPHFSQFLHLISPNSSSSLLPFLSPSVLEFPPLPPHAPSNQCRSPGRPLRRSNPPHPVHDAKFNSMRSCDPFPDSSKKNIVSFDSKNRGPLMQSVQYYMRALFPCPHMDMGCGGG